MNIGIKFENKNTINLSQALSEILIGVDVETAAAIKTQCLISLAAQTQMLSMGGMSPYDPETFEAEKGFAMTFLQSMLWGMNSSEEMTAHVINNALSEEERNVIIARKAKEKEAVEIIKNNLSYLVGGKIMTPEDMAKAISEKFDDIIEDVKRFLEEDEDED